ncbi:hypothetical protein NGRA_1562 [Nosema granulosis]|uniref:Uncharacterized protein n=1 Tax=Nosema granulosis TaxID=83296 RepID=A0A9P6KZ91_9MICR|nr:hypothetical protein NGRA_1562 [Nosema granulosis]
MLILNFMFIISCDVLKCLLGEDMTERIISPCIFISQFDSYYVRRMKDLIVVNKEDVPKNIQLFLVIGMKITHFYYRDANEIIRKTEVIYDDVFQNDFKDAITLIYEQFKKEKEYQNADVYLTFEDKRDNTIGENSSIIFSVENIWLFINEFTEHFKNFKYVPYNLIFLKEIKKGVNTGYEIYLKSKNEKYELLLNLSNNFYNELTKAVLRKIKVNKESSYNKFAVSEYKKDKQWRHQCDELDASIAIMLYNIKNSSDKIDSYYVVMIISNFFLNKVSFEKEALSILNSLSDSEKENLSVEYKKSDSNENINITSEMFLKMFKKSACDYLYNYSADESLCISYLTEFYKVLLLNFDKVLDICNSENDDSRRSNDLRKLFTKQLSEEIIIKCKDIAGIELFKPHFQGILRKIFVNVKNNPKKVVPFYFSSDFEKMDPINHYEDLEAEENVKI